MHSVKNQCGTGNEGGKVRSDSKVRGVNNRYTFPVVIMVTEEWNAYLSFFPFQLCALFFSNSDYVVMTSTLTRLFEPNY